MSSSPDSEHGRPRVSVADGRPAAILDALAVPGILWSEDQTVVHTNRALEQRFGTAVCSLLNGLGVSEIERRLLARRHSHGRPRRVRVVVGGEALFLMPVRVSVLEGSKLEAVVYIDVTDQVTRDAEDAERASMRHFDARSGAVGGQLADLMTALDGVLEAASTLDECSARDAIRADLRSLLELCAEASRNVRMAAAEDLPATILHFDAVPTLVRVARAYRDAGVHVSVEAPKRAPVACCPTGLERALRNATQNAVAAASEGEDGRVLLTLGPCTEPGMLRFTVEDDGPGFVRGFHREGAGLAQIRRFARSVRGRVEIGSSRLGGARLSLLVPADVAFEADYII